MSAFALKRHATRTRVLGGTSMTRETFNLATDIKAITLDDFRATLRGVALLEIQAQARAGNDQFTTTVDNRTAKPLAEAERKAIILWGATIGRLLMNVARETLIRAITGALGSRSGRLRNPANWEWLYIPGGGKTRRGVQINPTEIASFTYDDRLVLRPKPDVLPYAWFANWRAVGGGRHVVTRRKRGRAVSAVGFMGKAADDLRRRPELKQFSIYAAITRRFAPPGAARMGQPFFMFRLKMRGRV